MDLTPTAAVDGDVAAFVHLAAALSTHRHVPKVSHPHKADSLAVDIHNPSTVRFFATIHERAAIHGGYLVLELLKMVLSLPCLPRSVA